MDDKQTQAQLDKVYLEGIQDTLTIMRTVRTARPDPVRDVQAWLDRATNMGRVECRKLCLSTAAALSDIGDSPQMSVKPTPPKSTASASITSPPAGEGPPKK